MRQEKNLPRFQLMVTHCTELLLQTSGSADALLSYGHEAHNWKKSITWSFRQLYSCDDLRVLFWQMVETMLTWNNESKTLFFWTYSEGVWWGKAQIVSCQFRLKGSAWVFWTRLIYCFTHVLNIGRGGFHCHATCPLTQFCTLCKKSYYSDAVFIVIDFVIK